MNQFYTYFQTHGIYGSSSEEITDKRKYVIRVIRLHKMSRNKGCPSYMSYYIVSTVCIKKIVPSSIAIYANLTRDSKKLSNP